ncbi:MAG: hypothetical protein B7Z81_01260 [Acidocella sp. 20-61-6]|nr:MAG: hypothetical protein B7Z81_01260 [Acidocella sp. 20-61-6]
MGSASQSVEAGSGAERALDVSQRTVDQNVAADLQTLKDFVNRQRAIKAGEGCPALGRERGGGQQSARRAGERGPPGENCAAPAH